jgi:DNA-binding helix-hairpin-helix protein with protein kinase domain
MVQLLSGKQNILVRSSANCQIERLLGAGTQGEVYEADLGGKRLAMKWYYPQYLAADPELRERLKKIVSYGTPSDRFLWPIELVSCAGVQGFGYLMGLRDSRFRSIPDVMVRRVEPSFRALATAGFELANSYLRLHSMGLCYRDISWGNVFFDASSGEVRICDNDNVDIDGQPGPIYGTPKFMAPEIVRGDALPSVHTDLYSLAVLLFYLFFVHHPLDGAQEAAIKIADGPAMRRLYGTHPLFVFDPKDVANRPVPGYQDNVIAFWNVYPKFLLDLFTQAFTNGLRDPVNGRVRESAWRQAFVRLRDSIFSCEHCGAEVFYQQLSNGSAGPTCWSCTKRIGPVYRICIGSNTVILRQGAKLYPHHIDPHRLYDFSTPVAEVAHHPHNPKIWGLKNVSDSPWTAVTPEGNPAAVPIGRSVVLRPGTVVSLGRSEGRILYS